MEWGENWDGKQLAAGHLAGVVNKIRATIKKRILLAQTRRILARLSDNQLRDIGLTRDSLRDYR